MAEISFPKNEEVLSETKIKNNNSFITGSLNNYNIDGINTTNQENTFVDLFTSDTADSKTNMTYDSVNDRYNCDTGVGTETCTLIVSKSISTNDETVIVKADKVVAGTTTFNVYVSFDGGDTYTLVSENVYTKILRNTGTLKIKFVFSRTDTSSTDYITGFSAYYG